MKQMRLYIGFLVLLALGGCSSERFPGCCGSNGNRDVPFTETVVFDFKTGAGAITKNNPDGNLQIISSADLLTLLAAAQDTQNLGTGVVSGLVLYNGAPVQDVSLKATDSDGKLLAIRAEGRKIGNDLVLPDGMICPPELVSLDNICIKGSIYYNSPGGVPDFSNNKGTSTTGTFTIFNLPPGDVYLWASRGGRGTSRIKVFENKISVGKVQVVPISISTVGITGSVVDAEDSSTAVPQATVSVLGTADPGLTTVSDGAGLYSMVSIGANGNYLMKVSKPGYWPTYYSLNTTPFQATADVPDVTKPLTAYSNSYVAKVAATKGIQIDPSKGIITGRIKGGDGTPQHCAKLTGVPGAGITRGDGTDLTAQGAVIVYVDDSRGDCPPGSDQTSTNGLFFIFNLPANEEIYIKYISQTADTSSGPAPVVSGGMIAPSLPGVIFVQDMTNTGNGLTQELSGLITNENDTEHVADAQITIAGIDNTYSYQYSDDGGTTQKPFDSSMASSRLSNPAFTPPKEGYRIPQNVDPNSRIPLMGGITYLIKTSKPGSGYADTYQLVNMAGAVTKQNLLISSSNTSDSSLGEILGSVIDQTTGKLAENVTLKITDLAGHPVGGGEVTAAKGVFRVPNLPPTLINISVVSGDDSGNEVVRVYPNGVTVLDFFMAKVIPARVAVFGAVKNLDGSAVGQAQLKVRGQSEIIPSDGSGAFRTNLESFGQFVIKTEKQDAYDTYNFFPATGVIDAPTTSSLNLFSISRDQIAVFAAGAGITPDPANGIIAGTTVKNSLQLTPCPTSCTLSGGTHSAAMGYFNEDSLVDIAVTNSNSPGSVQVLFGDESGNFGNPKTITDGIGDTPVAIGAGNFDGNGNVDLVVINKGGGANPASITVLLGDKNGNFTPVANPLVDSNQSPLAASDVLSAPVAVAVGLFDSDTNYDIAVVNQRDVIVLLGNGNGTFHPIYQNTSIVRNGLESNPKAIVAGDFNQDSRLDMAIANADSGSVSVFLGSTDGTFQPLSDPNTGSPIVVPAGTDPEALVLLDANSDGRLDLAVVNKSVGTVTLLIGNVSGGFDPLKDASGKALQAIQVGGVLSAMTIGEFNGDNRVDLAVTRDDGTVLLLFGNGDGTFNLSDPISVGSITPSQILLQDTDRNGLLDLIVVGATEIVSLMGREEAVGGVSVEARNLDGERVGTVVYPGSTSTTSADGRFIVFNVPPGLTLVRNTRQGAGNKLMDSYPDSVSYTKIKTLSVQPFLVSVQGVTYDPVGPPPAGVPVGPVNIHLLGMDIKTKSDQSTGSYKFSVDANSEYIVRLFFDISRTSR